MKETISQLISEAIWSLNGMRKEKMTLKDRIKLETSITKLEIAKTLNYKFTNT